MNMETGASSNTVVKPKVRQAELDDFDQVYPLLKEINSKRLSKNDWFRLFQNHWSIDEFSPGIVLQAGNKIVGYMGTIYSRQLVAGEEQVFCNLTSWIVQDEYRSHSIMMIFSLIRKKNLILTSFSSNDVTYQVYKKLGFKDGNKSKRVVYLFPSFKPSQYHLITDKVEIYNHLSDNEKNIFKDHSKFNNAYALLKNAQDHCLLMGVNRKKLLKVYYASNREFLQLHINKFRSSLLLSFHSRKLQIDEHLLDGVPIFFSRKITRGNPYQYKTSNNSVSNESIFSKMPPLYTEIFLLDM